MPADTDKLWCAVSFEISPAISNLSVLCKYKMHFYLFLKVESLLLLSQALRLPYKERFWEYCQNLHWCFLLGGVSPWFWSPKFGKSLAERNESSLLSFAFRRNQKEPEVLSQFSGIMPPWKEHFRVIKDSRQNILLLCEEMYYKHSIFQLMF